MTTRRKFLTTTGILTGLGIFGKLFSQKEETAKEAVRIIQGNGELWQDEVDRSKEFDGMGEHCKRECNGGVKRIWVINTDFDTTKHSPDFILENSDIVAEYNF